MVSRTSIYKSLALAGLALALAVPAGALSPAYGPTVLETERVSLNNGSGVRLSSPGGAFRAQSQVVGWGIVGRSAGAATFTANHGTLGAPPPPLDDVYVDPIWVAQANVDADPTVGLAGCNPTGFTMIHNFNAFETVAAGVAAVNPNGRVHLMNGVHPAEFVALDKPLFLFGEDESVLACAGVPGRIGAIVEPFGPASPGKAVFQVESNNVDIRNMTIRGENGGGAPPEAEFAIAGSDATGAFDNLFVSNVGFFQFSNWAVSLLLPGTTGHTLTVSDFGQIGDAVGGSATGGGARFGGADALVDQNTFSEMPTAVLAFGGSVPLTPPVSGSGAIPSVTVRDNNFGLIGLAGGTQATVRYEYDATGLVIDNDFNDMVTGVHVANNRTTGSVVVEDNDFRGAMQVGVHASDIYAPTGAISPSIVRVTDNDFDGTMEMAAVVVRHVGLNSLGAPVELGSVTIDQNRFTDLEGSASSPHGIYVFGVNDGLGTVEITGNDIDAQAAGLAASGIHVTGQDTLFVPGPQPFSETQTVQVHGNTVTDWPVGTFVGHETGAGPAIVGAQIGTMSANAFTDNTVGVRADWNAKVDIGTFGGPVQVIEGGDFGVLMPNQAADVLITNNRIVDYNQAGIQVAGPLNQVLVSGNQVASLVTSAAAGVAAVKMTSAGGSTVDMGGGILGATGFNVFDASAPAHWAVIADVAGTYSAENNEWRQAGNTFNGAVAVDDLIRDGDTDNLASGGEAGTVGPLDFIPFVPSLPLTAVSLLDPSNDRAATFGYGAFTFRAMSDGIEATNAGGFAVVANGNYFSRHYDASADYVLPGLTVDRPLTIAGIVPGGATVFPGANGTGAPVAAIRDAGSNSIFEVQADDVTMADFVIDGDNPGIGGGVLVNGADVNSRNGIVLDGLAGPAPANFLADGLAVRNLFRSGIAADTNAGNPVPGPVVQGVDFTNIDAFAAGASNSSAVEFVNVVDATVQGGTVNEAQVGVIMAPNQPAGANMVDGVTLTNVDVTGIFSGFTAGAAAVTVQNNILTQPGGSLGILVDGVQGASNVTAQVNTITGSPATALLVSNVGPNALVRVSGNGLTGGGPLVSLAGIATVNIDRSTTGTGTLVQLNNVRDFSSGILVTDSVGGLPAAANIGTVVSSNTVHQNDTGVNVVSLFGTQPVDTLIGGYMPATDNDISNNAVAGVRFSGAMATGRVRGNNAPGLDNNVVGVLAENGSAVIVDDNTFANHATAGVLVRTALTEALIEDNTIDGATNTRGIRLEDAARASMGPGTPANFLANAYFGGMESGGFNFIENYTGVDPSFAIDNRSILDQNAETNAFGIVACAAPDPMGPPYIEDVVHHQVDDISVGLVLYCPPLLPGTEVRDWRVLDTN